jgi:tryptophanyl-tRNA synthetase
MSLKDPSQKMSKSDVDERSRIVLTDSPEDIHRKIKLALTDSEAAISYDPIHRPGVSNLIEIMSHIDSDKRSCEELAQEFRSAGVKALKEHVAKSLSNYLRDIRERYYDIMGKDASYLDTIANMGARKARRNADVTMQLVKSALGL